MRTSAVDSGPKTASSLLRFSAAVAAGLPADGENSSTTSEDGTTGAGPKKSLVMTRAKRQESDSSSGDQPAFRGPQPRKERDSRTRNDSFGPGVVGLDVLRNSNRQILRLESDEEEDDSSLAAGSDDKRPLEERRLQYDGPAPRASPPPLQGATLRRSDIIDPAREASGRSWATSSEGAAAGSGAAAAAGSGAAAAGQQQQQQQQPASFPSSKHLAAVVAGAEESDSKESSGEHPRFKRSGNASLSQQAQEASSESSDEEPLPPPIVKPRLDARTQISVTPKLGKLLGQGPALQIRKRSLTTGEAPQLQSVKSPTAGTESPPSRDKSPLPSPRQQQSHNMAKVSKFFGTVISEETASALNKAGRAKTLRQVSRSAGFGYEELAQQQQQQQQQRSPSRSPRGSRSSGRPIGASTSATSLSVPASPALEAAASPSPTHVSPIRVSPRPSHGGVAVQPVTRMRRSSSVGSFDSPSWVRERSPRSSRSPATGEETAAAAAAAAAATHRDQKTGRLSMTLWRPSGVTAKEKLHFEVVVDYTTIYKSPPLHAKKPEWSCNVCCDAGLDSLIMVRLYRGSKPDAVKCHLRVDGLCRGIERTSSLEFPGGERQQVTLLALDFGPAEREPQPPVSSELLDAPSVLDVVVVALHDLRLSKKPGTSALVVQASYQSQVMRSAKLWLEPTACNIAGINTDCTFRLCAANSMLQLLLATGESFPGEPLCCARINLARHPPATGPTASLFVCMRDRKGRGRAFVQLRYSVSSPLRGMLSQLGPPLAGVPLRLEWGDVLLFSLKSLSAQVVSAATASAWDHVGIVYEEDGKMFLLEAVSGGVQAPELNQRVLDALAAGAKLGVRRLVVPRSAELRAELWTFAVAMTGRSYKKSVGQLVQSRWGRNKADDLSSVFCSELVAAAFKHLQLIDESVVTSNILPKDLAGTDFVMTRGALQPLIVYSSRLHSLFASTATNKRAADFVGYLSGDVQDADGSSVDDESV